MYEEKEDVESRFRDHDTRIGAESSVTVLEILAAESRPAPST